MQLQPEPVIQQLLHHLRDLFRRCPVRTFGVQLEAVGANPIGTDDRTTQQTVILHGPLDGNGERAVGA